VDSRSGTAVLGPSSRTLAAILLLLVASGIGAMLSHSLWSPDEPTGAVIGRNMLRNGDFVVPEVGGSAFLEKPPLFWWVQAVAYRALGAHDWTARLPSTLFALLTLAVTCAIGRRVSGPATGLLAMLVLATMVGFAEESSRATVDSTLTCFVALCHLGFVQLVQATRSRQRWGAALVVAVATPLAFLAKGFAGIALGCAPPVLFLLVTERRRVWSRLRPLVALAVPIFLLVVAPWLVVLARHAGARAVRELLVNNTLGRMIGPGDAAGYGHRHGPLFYFLEAPLFLMPWTLALPAALRRKRPALPPGDPVRNLLVAIAPIGIAGLSLATTKRASYLLPLLPSVAVVVADWLASLPGRELPALDRRALRAIATTGALLLVALGIFFPALFWFPSSSTLLESVRRSCSGALAAIVASAALALAGLVFQRQRRLPPVVSPRALIWMFLPLAAALFGYQTAIKHTIDPIKNLHLSTAAVTRWIPGAADVPIFVPRGEQAERLVAIIDFDLARKVERLSDPTKLDLWIAAHPGGRLLVGGESLSELSVGSRARLAPLYDERGRTTAEFVIFEVFAAAAPG
jgi:4-amino-4-deoxy-L-arabinose transferase-like glycosyltransferase